MGARSDRQKRACITLRIVGAREARLLNRHYRGRDYATNVLTFVYSDRRPLAGDIAICAPVVAREARACGISREAHYAHLTVHGVLHLQGYDHERARDAERMERLEVRILAAARLMPIPIKARKRVNEGASESSAYASPQTTTWTIVNQTHLARAPRRAA